MPFMHDTGSYSGCEARLASSALLSLMLQSDSRNLVMTSTVRFDCRYILVSWCHLQSTRAKYHSRMLRPVTIWPKGTYPSSDGTGLVISGSTRYAIPFDAQRRSGSATDHLPFPYGCSTCTNLQLTGLRTSPGKCTAYSGVGAAVFTTAPFNNSILLLGIDIIADCRHTQFLYRSNWIVFGDFRSMLREAHYG